MQLNSEFVSANMPSKKPRKMRVLNMRGPHYTSVSYGYLKDHMGGIPSCLL